MHLTRSTLIHHLLLITTVIVGILLPALSVAEAQEIDKNVSTQEIPPALTLTVLRVIDDDFSDISDNDLDEILETAKATAADKLGLTNITFVDAGKKDIESFFSENLDFSSTSYKQINDRRYLLDRANDFEAHKPQIIKFLNKWTIQELQSLFPEADRHRYDSYDKLFGGVAAQMREKITKITAVEWAGKKLLRKEKAAYRSFINWLAVLEAQSKYDLVLTNTFILFDDIAHPQPHSVFGKCKVGGVSHRNEKLVALEGRVIMGSTFGMDTPLDQFRETQSEVSISERNRVTGAYIIAHELGHAVFKLPDHYNHPPQCLMNNLRGQSYVEGYRILKEHPGRCPVCEKWLDARLSFWKGENDFSNKRWQDAISAYTDVVKKTPRNVDGSWAAYIARVAYQMSKAYYKLGDYKMAVRAAETAVKLYKWEPQYIEWRDQLRSSKEAGKEKEVSP